MMLCSEPIKALNPNPAPRVMTVNETCAALRISRTAFYNMVNKGTLPVVKLGKRTMVSVREIDRLLGEANEAA